jgi:hypothetical protein
MTVRFEFFVRNLVQVLRAKNIAYTPTLTYRAVLPGAQRWRGRVAFKVCESSTTISGSLPSS